jgi:hypothetical protein
MSMEAGSSSMRENLVDAQRSAILSTAARYISENGLAMGGSENMLQAVADTFNIQPNSVYSGWENAQAFYGDVLLEVARSGHPSRVDDDTLIASWQFLAMSAGGLRDEESRHHLLMDIIRTAAEHNFIAISRSSSWKNFVMLSVSADLPANRKAEIESALQRNETEFLQRMAGFYKTITDVLGYRLKPHLVDGYEALSLACAALIEGLSVVRKSAKPVIEKRFPREAGGRVPWSVVSLAFVGIVETFIELDPDYDVDAAYRRIGLGVETAESDRKVDEL